MAFQIIKENTSDIWRHSIEDGSLPDTILSDGFFKFTGNTYELFSESGGLLRTAELTNIEVIDNTGAGNPETFTTVLGLITRLKALAYPYFKEITAASGPVTSVFGRTGAIVAVFSDYLSSLVQDDSIVAGATVKDALNTLSGQVTSIVSTTGIPLNNQFAVWTDSTTLEGIPQATFDSTDMIFGETNSILTIRTVSGLSEIKTTNRFEFESANGIRISDIGKNVSTNILPTPSGITTLTAPSNSGIIPISVNGVPANSLGNIVIAIGIGDMLLNTIQTITAAKTFNDGTFLLDDSDSIFNLIIGSTSTITSSNKTLTLDVNDGDRILIISGDANISNINTGDQDKTNIDGLGINAAELGGLTSLQFLRSDITDTKQGDLLMALNAKISLNTKSTIFGDLTDTILDLLSGDLLIQDTGVTKITIKRTTGNFTTTGSIQAGHDVGFKSKNVAGGERTLITIDSSNILRIKGNSAEGSNLGISIQGTGDVDLSNNLDVLGTGAVKGTLTVNNPSAGTEATLNLIHSGSFDSSKIVSDLDTFDMQDAGSSMLQFFTNDNSTTSPSLSFTISSENNAFFEGNISISGIKTINNNTDDLIIDAAAAFKNVKIQTQGVDQIVISPTQIDCKDNNIITLGKIAIGTAVPTKLLTLRESIPEIHFIDNDVINTGFSIKVNLGEFTINSINDDENFIAELFNINRATEKTTVSALDATGDITTTTSIIAPIFQANNLGLGKFEGGKITFIGQTTDPGIDVDAYGIINTTSGLVFRHGANPILTMTSSDNFDFASGDLITTGDVTANSFNDTFITQVSLSSAQILSIFTTPITLIADPGPGKLINILSVIFDYTFITSAYVANDLVVQYTNGGASFSKGILSETTNKLRKVILGANDEMLSNEAIVATSTIADPFTGAGTVKINLTYNIITL